MRPRTNRGRITCPHDQTTTIPGDPMTLGNMRANGVRSLDVSCWPPSDDPERGLRGPITCLLVPSFGLRMGAPGRTSGRIYGQGNEARMTDAA
jgi:hypothetical protein